MAVALIPIVNCMSKIKLPTSTPPFVYRTLPQIVCYVVYGVIFVVLTVLVCLNARKVYRNVGLNSAASSPRLQQQPWSHHLSSGLIPRRRFLGLAHFPRGDFPRGDFSRGDFSRGDFPRGDFPRGDFPRGDFPRGDFPRGDFPVADCPTDFPRNNAQDDLIGTAKGDIGRRRLSRRRLRQSLRFSRKPSRVTPSLMKPSLVRPTLNERLQTGAGYRAEGYRGEEAFREGGFLEGGFREGGFREGGFRERRTKPLVRGPYWWLLLGNIELFRYDLNSLLCGNSIFRVDVFWSMSIKYSAPLLLTLLLYHQAEDADGSISGNRFTRGYLGVMNPEIVPTNRFQLKMSVNIPIAVALCAALLTTTISIRNPGFCRRLGPPSSSIPAMSWWPRREFNLRGPRAWQTLKQLFFLEFTRHRSQDLDEHSSEEPDNFAAAEKCADIILGRIDDSDDQHIPETSDDLFS
ncbi:putative transmembrane protein [Gregarina niphandrodes]|uniref:Transmembrane protein n=1 Tax=Gregarina niphandrodes TaxID=110365 RepID=A0A023BC40_GRENI|nr:putative transmembrane protein [Gregarina niphandrodes]EZG81602.1 putative transmembrane protein [Gregarina niphandrodes]|eukprot:XP_011134217.1 putative transmembrane protein [Gregarina niphandrodes]